MKDRLDSDYYNYWCKSCVKRNTIYCPNIDKCFEKEEKTYYQDKFMLLEKNQKLIEDIIGYEQERNNLIKSIPFKENKKLKNQQKEFIQWLENQIQKQETYGGYFSKFFQDVLSKYKEIIGGDNK